MPFFSFHSRSGTSASPPSLPAPAFSASALSTPAPVARCAPPPPPSQATSLSTAALSFPLVTRRRAPLPPPLTLTFPEATVQRPRRALRLFSRRRRHDGTDDPFVEDNDDDDYAIQAPLQMRSSSGPDSITLEKNFQDYFSLPLRGQLSSQTAKTRNHFTLPACGPASLKSDKLARFEKKPALTAPAPRPITPPAPTPHLQSVLTARTAQQIYLRRRAAMNIVAIGHRAADVMPRDMNSSPAMRAGIATPADVIDRLDNTSPWASISQARNPAAREGVFYRHEGPYDCTLPYRNIGPNGPVAAVRTSNMVPAYASTGDHRPRPRYIQCGGVLVVECSSSLSSSCIDDDSAFAPHSAPVFTSSSDSEADAQSFVKCNAAAC
ncbi:uncharacterized protein V1518DRAFT_419391 [Limtongia smithiae]|uniref:uncharacterized protein n=1 Tax=Limtongia smithiae TaxID=1125753 RepID=UPI0034CE921E